ncbi:MAG: YceI family protein [Ginsengibacter sp.]
MIKYLFIFVTFISLSATAQNYVPGDAGSNVHFVIKHFGFNAAGDFTGLKGEILFDAKNISSSMVNLSVDAASINTDNDSRDKSLRTNDYFDVKKFPLINLKSTKISNTNKTSEGFYFFTGNFTIRDSTHSISFPFKAEKTSDGYSFSGEFDIDRLDYGVGAQSAVLGDKVKISFKVNARKQ